MRACRYRAEAYFWELALLLARFPIMVLGEMFQKSDAGWGSVFITAALLIMQIKYKPFLESKAEAGHWSSPNVMSVISYVCQLVVLAVGLASGYEEQGRIERRAELEYQAHLEYEELSAQGQNPGYPAEIPMEKQDEGDALLLSVVGTAALIIPLILTGIIIKTGGAPLNTADDASTNTHQNPLNAEISAAEAKARDGEMAASESE